MKMLARPGDIRAALTTAIAYCTPAMSHQANSKANKEAHFFGLFPVNILVGELGEIPELELYSRRLRRADQSWITFIWYALTLLEINHRHWEPGRRVEHGEHAVCEILCAR